MCAPWSLTGLLDVLSDELLCSHDVSCLPFINESEPDLLDEYKWATDLMTYDDATEASFSQGSLAFTQQVNFHHQIIEMNSEVGQLDIHC